MIFFNNFFESLIIVYLYMFLYNISFGLIFWILQNVLNSKLKTIFSFKDFKLNFHMAILVTLILFSLAGVPPFAGFFSKLLILINLLNSTFSVFFVFFFALLFLGLYFYLQNIKFLLSNTNARTEASFHLNIRLNKTFFGGTTVTIFFLIFGVFFFDDLILFFYWIFS